MVVDFLKHTEIIIQAGLLRDHTAPSFDFLDKLIEVDVGSNDYFGNCQNGESFSRPFDTGFLHDLDNTGNDFGMGVIFNLVGAVLERVQMISRTSPLTRKHRDTRIEGEIRLFQKRLEIDILRRAATDIRGEIVLYRPSPCRFFQFVNGGIVITDNVLDTDTEFLCDGEAVMTGLDLQFAVSVLDYMARIRRNPAVTLHTLFQCGSLHHVTVNARQFKFVVIGCLLYFHVLDSLQSLVDVVRDPLEGRYLLRVIFSNPVQLTDCYHYELHCFCGLLEGLVGLS